MTHYLRTSALNMQIDFVNKMLTKVRQRMFFNYKKKKKKLHAVFHLHDHSEINTLHHS